MLHWLAGQKVQEADPDATNAVESPETPAPVFAVRAFKHALFGTPATVQAKAPRRHSNTENGKPRPNTRPAIVRPRSTNDAQTMGMFGTPTEDEPMQSPTKGILMTPGTATARRKTVSFGDGVLDNEGKGAGKSGLPDDCPGKYSSPFVRSIANEPTSSEKPRGRSKLTEALEQARDESAKRKSRTVSQTANKTASARDKVEVFLETSESKTESGKDWKLEYDQYRERTERELRKVVLKQKAAKSFARDRDTLCTELEEELRQEMKNTSRLEEQLRRMEEKLRIANAEKAAALEELARMKRSLDSSEHRRAEKQEADTLRSRQSREQMAAVSRQNDCVNSTTTAPPRRSRAKLGGLQMRTSASDDTTPQLVTSSTISDARTTPSPTSPKSKRAKSPENPIDPLKSLSINTIPKDTLSVALSMGLQPPSPKREHRSDSPMRSPKIKPQELPPPPPAKDDIAKSTISQRPNILTGSPVPVRSTIHSAKPSLPTKENVSPTVPAVEDAIRPSAAWARISTPAIERAKLPAVTVAAVDESSNKADLDRQAAARARIMARVSSR